MPDYEYPGVYVEELPFGARSIEGVETSTAAFVGRALEGPTEPVRVRAFVEYERVFGPPDPERELGHAVRGFFDNGGACAWIVRVDDSEPLSRGLNALEGVSGSARSVDVTLRAALGSRPRASDMEEFVAALTESFALDEVRDIPSGSGGRETSGYCACRARPIPRSSGRRSTLRTVGGCS